MRRAGVRASLVVAIAAVGVGVAVAPRGGDVSPWTTTHAGAVTADGAAAGRVAVEPFVITRRVDISSP